MAPLSPVLGIDAAVTRRTIDGKNPGGWFPEQRITVEEALARLHVGRGLRRLRGEGEGVSRAGKLADFVVLSADPLSVPPEEIEKIQVEQTVVGGRVVFGASVAFRPWS